MQAMFARGCVCVCECVRSKGVPVGAGRMCRGHQQQRLGEDVRVSRSVCAGQRCLVCVWRMGAPCRMCWGVVVLCVTVCACFGVTSCFCVWGGVSVLQGCGSV